VSGDTVLVKPGTYDDFEVRLVFGNVAALGFPVDGVTLLSEAGPESTVLDLSAGEGLAPSVRGLWIGGVGNSETRVQGFTITGAPSSGGSAIVARFSQNVVILDCTFDLDDPSSGTDEFRGGVQFIYSSGRLEDCRFTGCRGPSGAGLWQLGGPVTVERTTFEGCKNEAMRVGESPMTIVRNCMFDSNVTSNPAAGGIVGISPGVVENCVFVGNEGFGSGAAISGGSLQVRDCFFDSNRSLGLGGTLKLGGFANVIENNTILRSIHAISSPQGSAILVTNSSANLLRNNIIAFSSGSAAIGLLNANLTSECNVFWQNADGIGSNYVPGPTDREVDPLFCNPDMDDWTLRKGSPCLPEDPSGCGLIGVFGQGCGLIGLEPVTWGKIKNCYRGTEEKASASGNGEK
jgi:hypothetical protein